MPQRTGVLPAIVIDNVDPLERGRVKVRLIQPKGSTEPSQEMWARVATLSAGNNNGSWFMPDINDEVLVALHDGRPIRCYVIGGLWNALNRPPDRMQPENHRKLLRSRNGLKITLDDRDGQESLEIETPGGQKIVLKDGPGEVEIADSHGNSVKFESAGITITAAAKVTLNATTVEVSASMVTVSSGMANFSGVVKCDTLISNSVISSSYTPGTGNIW